MATQEDREGAEFGKLNENLVKVEELSQRLIAALSRRKPAKSQLNAPSQELFAKAQASYLSEFLENPGKLYEQQLQFWGHSVRNFVEAQQALLKDALPGDDEALSDPLESDPRFAHPLWKGNPYFKWIKHQYSLNAQAIRDAVDTLDELDPVDRKRLDYFAHQIIDMMAPTNFLGTNPDALERALETEGASLVKGLENLVADLEANKGEMVVRLADERAFELGVDIATTKGEVVYRNELMELIQYHPSTEKVHATPVVIFPPWINKFYILDLKPQNSLIKWIVDQGYTLFVVSWVNADLSHADIGIDDYIEKGFLTAISEAKRRTNQKQVNAVGYCIAGTTLHLTLALMAKRGDKSVKSATFFTALTDFSEQGEFVPFLQDDFIDGIEDEVKAQGVLRSFILSRTMSFLRSNDLIYKPAIKSYMMGETPPAFDLLYWNGDGSNLPGRMAIEYLRKLCQDNAFVTDGIDLCGERLHISDVKIPLMAVTCISDHIAAWKDCYRGFLQTGTTDRSFIVSESGHIAGIVNPPSKKKYGYFRNDTLPPTAEDWLASAREQSGSWWPEWESWLGRRSGRMVTAREVEDALEPAPGTYVRKKAII